MRLAKRLRCLALLLVPASAALAQRDPHIGYVYPAGGQVGTTFEVSIGGQTLGGATNAYVSGTGVQAVVLPFEPIINFKQADELRMRAQELRKKDKSPDVLKELNDIRRKLAAFERRRIAPALAEMIPVRIAIAPNAAPGNRELRLGTYTALSNPMVFQVGQLPEVREPEGRLEGEGGPPKSFKEISRGGGRATQSSTNLPAMNITLPATINGQILPGEVERYRFKARQGQQLIVIISARELIPYLADAVPGWFQAKAVLYDSQGKELTYDDHYKFHPDPVLFYTIPKEGDYILEIRDSLYRGREDFVYRITVGELPFIANVFPLGARVGAQPTVAIWGWNLPTTQLTLNLAGVEPGLYPFTVRNYGQISNHMPFLVDTLPECLKEPGRNSPTNAQRVTLPIIINGHIDQPGDVDVFRFEGRAGDRIVAEVFARRLDSPLDSALKLTDATGKQIAFNDDFEDKGTGLNTHHADSYIATTLPTSGTYFLYLWDTQQKGGWAYGYRLRLSAPRPDYELRAVPSSICLRPGNSAPITVFALRRDGFTNAIAVSLKNPPTGFKLTGGSLVATQEQVKLTFTVPSKSTLGAYALNLEGRASVMGRDLVHHAVPADDMMQAFAYRHLVPAQELKVVVTSGPPPKPPEKKTDTTTPSPLKPNLVSPTIKIPSGGTARVQVRLPNTNYTGKLQLELDDPPEGVAIKSFIPTRNGAEIVFQADATKMKPGQKGDLTVNAFAERTNTSPSQPKSRASLGAAPPIRFEITAALPGQK